MRNISDGGHIDFSPRFPGIGLRSLLGRASIALGGERRDKGEGNSRFTSLSPSFFPSATQANAHNFDFSATFQRK